MGSRFSALSFLVLMRDVHRCVKFTGLEKGSRKGGAHKRLPLSRLNNIQRQPKGSLKMTSCWDPFAILLFPASDKRMAPVKSRAI